MVPATLLNHLWQSTAFATAAAALALLLRHHQARVRFWIWLAASLKFLVPFAAFASLAEWLRALLPAPAAHAAAAPLAVSLSQPFTRVLEIGGAAAPAAVNSHALLYVLAVVWLAGTVALLVRWRRRWRRLAQADRSVLEPGVYGVFRQRLLLPPDLEARLSPAEFAAVLAHEHCHMRRRDNLWSALHMLVEALFWFHPFVWIIGERLVAERERACDEAVLAAQPDRAAYAGAVLAVCRHYLAVPVPCASGIAGGRLTARVRAILAGELGRRLSRSQRVAVAAAALVGIAGPILLLAAQHPAPPTHFEAATIKPIATLPVGDTNIDVDSDAQHYSAEGITLQRLITSAYDLQTYQVKGPTWISRKRYDITAVTAKPVTTRQGWRTLLQPFLAERFHLKYHWSSKIASEYWLEVAPGGSKLQKTGPGHGESDAHSKGGAVDAKLDGTMGRFAQFFSRRLDEPVVDRTGLTGTYAAKLTFEPLRRLHGSPPAAPSLFVALEQQLGLRLVRGKGPVKIFVVDQASPTPTPY
ncbi:MAG: TIGR03435 family protein [Terriglobales bacterium]